MFSDKPKLIFTDSKLTIKTMGTSVEHEIGNVRRIYYKDVSASSIAIHNVNMVSYDGFTLTIANAEIGTEVIIYSIDGKIAMKEIIGTIGTVTLQLGKLQRGIYIVKFNGQTFKFSTI